MTFAESRAVRDAVRDGIARTVAVLGLGAFALIHLLDLPGTMKDTPYIGWLYIGLIVSAITIASALMRTSSTVAWTAVAGLVTSVMIAYILSRTIGLPQSSDDIGNWGQSLGIEMLFVGGSLLGLSSAVLFARWGRPGSQRSHWRHDSALSPAWSDPQY
jgi:hypothetical protein